MSQLNAGVSGEPLWKRWGVWLGLAAVLALYITAVVRLHPTNFFGLSNDDMLYFSSAKAIAEGNGYVLPSVPGAPLATKQPILLPWLLSWVWRWDPSFPGNLSYAIAVIMAFGCGFICTAFLFLRRLPGMSDAEALLLTAFCALHPGFLFYSGSILSDVPFAALALAAMLIASRSVTRGSAGGAAAAGIVAGLSILVRAAGVPIAAGIALAYVFRKAWKPLAVFAMCAAPFFVGMMWRSIFLVPAIPAPLHAAALPGWQQTWLYYTNYAAFRKLVFMNMHAFWPMTLGQFLYLCLDVPGYFTSPLMLKEGGSALISTVVGLWIIVGGFARSVRKSSWQAIHLSLILYIALFLTWDYPDWERFLLPFLPLLAGYFWLEGKRITKRCLSQLNTGCGRADTLLAGGVLVLVLALGLGVCWNFAGGGERKWLTSTSGERGALLPEKREAYEWLKWHSAKNSRAIAMEDAALYLYSGRQAMQAISFLPSGPYDPGQIDRDLDHITDVARAIGAEYWFTASDDDAQYLKSVRVVADARLGQVESVLPEVFRSKEGHVRIYGLDCVRRPETAGCESADRLLFPEAQDERAPEAGSPRSVGLTGSPQTTVR
ncbi:MAG TPA: hypothetical protein VN682_20675 [Terriglobales bacterium]|nr:hypothetical protein [Terriglobales bacterium]